MRVKKIFFIFVLLLIALTIINPPAQILAASSDYQWFSPTKIIATTEKTSYNQITEKLGDIGTLLGYGNATVAARDNYFYRSEKKFPYSYSCRGASVSSEDFAYITVNKETPNIGIRYRFVGGCSGVPYEKRDISLDFTNLGPKPIKKITKGAIWGKVVASDQWPKDNKTIFSDNVIGRYIRFESTEGYDITFTNHGFLGGAPSAQIGDNYAWSRYTFSDEDYVYEGNYKLTFDYEDSSGCQSGSQASTSGVGFCSTAMKGEVIFSLVAESDGSAAIKLSGNDDVEQNAPGNNKNTKDLAGSADNGLLLSIGYKISSPFDNIMTNAMAAVLNGIREGIKLFGGWINGMLNYGNDINNDALGQVWARVRNVSLGLLTLGILIIAFCNILQIDLEKYGLNRMIPRLVIALVMTYFSFLIIRFLLELTSALQSLALGGESLDVANLGGGKFSAAFSGDIGSMTNSIGLLIILFLIGFILMIAMLWLCLVLIVRVAVLWFLVALAPIAFLMMIMPFTEGLYKQWWEKFWKWAFMGPAIAFMLYMTNAFLMVGFGNSFAAKDAVMDDAGTWIFLLMATAGVFISASVPFTMGGDIYGAIQKGWSKYGQKLPGYKFGKGFLDQRKTAGDQRRNRRIQAFQSRLANVPVVGRGLAGVDAGQARAIRMSTLNNMADSLPADSRGVNEAIAKSTGLKRQAAILKASKEGWLDDGNDAVVRAVSEVIERDQIPDLGRTLAKEQSDFVVSAAMKVGGKNMIAAADKTLEKTSYQDYKPKHWDYFMHKNGAQGMQEFVKDITRVEGIMKNAKPESRQAFADKVISSGAHVSLSGRQDLLGAILTSASAEVRSNLRPSGSNNTNAIDGTDFYGS